MSRNRRGKIITSIKSSKHRKKIQKILNQIQQWNLISKAPYTCTHKHVYVCIFEIPDGNFKKLSTSIITIKNSPSINYIWNPNRVSEYIWYILCFKLQEISFFKGARSVKYCHSPNRTYNITREIRRFKGKNH